MDTDTKPREHKSTECLTTNVVLVGMMGSGKTSVGKRIANQLGVAFRDSDEEVVKFTGHSIEHICASWGLEAYHDAELVVIEKLLHNEPYHILATGHGAFTQPAIRALVERMGVSIWLQAPFDVIYTRVKRRPRPQLLDKVDKDLLLALRDLMMKCESAYMLSNFCVNIGNRSCGEISAEIIRLLRSASLLYRV